MVYYVLKFNNILLFSIPWYYTYIVLDNIKRNANYFGFNSYAFSGERPNLNTDAPSISKINEP